VIDWSLILTAALILAATVVVIYTLSALKEWIRERIGIFRNRQIVTGALRDRLETGHYKVIPFIFDERADVVLDTDHIEAEQLDEELEEKFAGRDELILEIQH